MKQLLIASLALSIVLCGCSKGDPSTADSSTAPSKNSTMSTPPATDGKTTGATAGSGSPSTPPPADAGGTLDPQLAGTWKVDLASTTIQTPNAEAKKEESEMRFDLKADGSLSIKSGATTENGKWSVKGTKVVFTSDKPGNPPLEMDISADKKKISLTQPGGAGKTVTMTLVKA